MSGVTEIAWFPLKPGHGMHDASSAARQAFVSAFAIVLAQPGARRIIYGTELENPDTLRLFVDWDSVEDHHGFMQSAPYIPMLGKVQPHFDTTGSGPVIRHVAPRPFPSAPLAAGNSPVVEIFTAYFAPGIGRAEQDAYAGRFEEFSGKGLPPANRVGTSGGWSLESDIVNPKDGRPGKVFVGFIGWSSKEEHLEWRSEDAFKSNIHLLREGPVHLVATHIKPEEMQGGAEKI